MIATNDAINGMFELVGGIVIWHNVRRLLQAKRTLGISWSVQGFFAIWGWWNLWYYPSLHQWCSFAGGVLLVIGNTVWVVLAIHYHRVNTARKDHQE